jgi:hypothetical protein
MRNRLHIPKRAFPYIVFGTILLIVRAYANFSFDLIPGTNGGYYPLQVRSILENGQLGFPDMPLYFFINAAVVKLSSWFSTAPVEVLIIHTTKVFDILLLPLAAIPLYCIEKHFLPRSTAPVYRYIVIGFAMLSFGPLMLLSDLQKNAAAIPFFVAAFYFLLAFLRTPSLKTVLLASLFLFLTALTHFGVFAISLLFVTISLFVFYGKRAILPVLSCLFLSFMVIYFWDATRAIRLLSAGTMIFGFTNGPPALFHPGTLANIVLSIFLIMGALRWIRPFQSPHLSFEEKTGLVLVIGLLLLVIPFYGDDLARRFSLMVFIPQAILALLILPKAKKWLRIAIVTLAGLMTILPLSATFLHPKTPTLTAEQITDLQAIAASITAPENTLILARHGLEWWVGWYLHTKVGQDKALDAKTFDQYPYIYSLVQKTQREDAEHRHPPFPEAYAPKSRASVIHNPTFQLIRLYPSDLDGLNQYHEDQKKGPPHQQAQPTDEEQ